ncbi:MAG TPA: Holliday junction resolvase RuvX [Pseudomonadales bacterium]|nr:Holliday junction resolvase RuvX [Pseudomonadales bacterium]
MPAAHQTLLAFDYGLRHIGVAVGQTLISSSNPAGIVRARDGVPDWNAIAKLIKEWQPQLLLVGLPLNMDGTDSPMSLRARKFSRQLQEKYKVAVELVDERLSSFAAKQARKEAQSSIDFGRDTVDAEAACIILQDYYNRTPATPQQ